ncbi:YqfQ family protein [Sporosarcina sp. NCCP-2222]|uniref:YqfQ family protein n=1 Tax=Sporosarcina sp. NCCP-2222 TaxID=2935073 RepID=UPI0020BDA4A1|nr:YqfQ family protein [Sporosarcina sp. NCCP-2222]
MRYQSFYPFMRQQQSSPIAMRPSGFGPQFQPGNQPMPRQPFPGPGMGNQFGAAGQGAPGQNTSKMEMYMQTANRFMNTAQQYAPLIQQFAPMIQNLPAMWKLYKGFQSIPSAGTAAQGAANAAAAAAPRAAARAAAGVSTPRIFQPPTI